jgi:FAD-dependent urate hydroxylase
VAAGPRVAVVGSGPYGLAATAHLRAAGVQTHTLGRPMVFWRERMPNGMFLRSAWEASSIGHPHGRLTLDEYRDEHAPTLSAPIPVVDFLRYADWFRQHEVPDLDEREIVRIDRPNGEFRLLLRGGDELHVRRVVVAAGLAPFAARPPQFDGVPPELASHASEHTDFEAFAGRRVLVVGGGQSALESAALLGEAGAEVTVAVRATHLHWLPAPRLTGRLGSARRRLYRPVLHRLLYPPTDVGPPVLNWIVATPGVFRAIPRLLQEPIALRCIRPAGAHWLQARLAEIELRTGCSVRAAAPDAGRLRITLDDGTTELVDHALLATGFRIDVGQFPFLAPELAGSVATSGGYPILQRGFESSVSGLHFIGAPSAKSFGPIMRFVCGTRFTGPQLAHHIAGQTRGGGRRGRGVGQTRSDAARTA